MFLSDLEKALFYALSHEVAQHATIAGSAAFVLFYALSYELAQHYAGLILEF